MQVLIQGLVRSPDREGALAHLDTERGFAFVGRGSMSLIDVIDPARVAEVPVKLEVSFETGADALQTGGESRRNSSLSLAGLKNADLGGQPGLAPQAHSLVEPDLRIPPP